MLFVWHVEKKELGNIQEIPESSRKFLVNVFDGKGWSR